MKQSSGTMTCRKRLHAVNASPSISRTEGGSSTGSKKPFPRNAFSLITVSFAGNRMLFRCKQCIKVSASICFSPSGRTTSFSCLQLANATLSIRITPSGRTSASRAVFINAPEPILSSAAGNRTVFSFTQDSKVPSSALNVSVFGSKVRFSSFKV